MKTSKIIFISFFSFIGMLLLAFMILGIAFKDKRILKRRKLQTPSITITVDKRFKHVVIKNDIFYEVKKQKEFSVKNDEKENSSFIGDSKNSVAEDLSLRDETSLQNRENNKLPEFFYGEWYQKDGNREYNGMLIRPDFMEHFYQACTYDKIEKGDYSYIVTVKCDNGSTATYEIQQIAKDVITVVLPDGEITIFHKVDTPLNGIRVQLEDLPNQLRNKWYTTDGNNNIEFDLTGNDLIFKGSKYRIEDVVFFRESWGKQFRIIAKNSVGKTMMFYFKNWSDRYCQVGYYGEFGELYKNKHAYPNRYRDASDGKNKSKVLIFQGNEQTLTYYRYVDTDSLNAPVIEVENDTLYLVTN